MKKIQKVDKIDNAHSSYTDKYQGHNSCSFAYKIGCIDNRFSKPVLLYQRKDAVYGYVEGILKAIVSLFSYEKKESYFCMKILFILSHIRKITSL